MWVGVCMSRWCFNIVNINGPSESISLFLKNAKGASVYIFSIDTLIEKIIEWDPFSDIYLDITLKEVEAYNETAKSDKSFSLNALYRVPPALQMLPYDRGYLLEIRKLYKSVDLFCKKNNITMSQNEWELENWGVKWGAMSTNLDKISKNEIVLTFETAVNPPIPFWDKVSKDYPDLKIEVECQYEDDIDGLRYFHFKNGLQK
jgi:hypothetical protein